MIQNNLLSLKIKIIFLISILLIVVTTILTIIYVKNLDEIIASNTHFISTSMIKTEKQELQDKIDLANNILAMYYKQSTPTYMENVVKKSLISHQDQLFHQLQSIYTLYKDKESQEDLKKRLLTIIKYARYGSNGYFWVNDMDAKMIMHPIKPHYNGHYFIHTPRVPFVELAITKLQQKKTDATFIKYNFYNPSTQKYEFKVSLVKIFKPYNWIIGTGQYLSDITPLIKQHAIDDIKALRYGKNGYFWINNTNYQMIMHPIKPEYNGKYFKNTPKVPFVALGIEALKKSSTQSAIIQYKFYNPSTQKYENKLSVVKLFKPWNWIIGTGVYLQNINETIKTVEKNKQKQETQLIIKIILITTLILFVTLLLAYQLIKKFITDPIKTLNNEKKHFQEVSQIDYLTNIYNRRAFFKEFQVQQNYANQNNLILSVCIIDIDYFKNINDKYGHEAGDKVLQNLVKTIQKNIRIKDIFGRLGGEEFAIAFIHNEDFSLQDTAKKIKDAVENTPIQYNNQTISITISLGIYTLHTPLEQFNEAFNKADQALYKAKQTGRNKVVISTS